MRSSSAIHQVRGPRILIVRLSSFGDVVNALPTAHALRRQYPHAWIGWVVDRNLAPLLAPVECVDEVFPLPLPNGRSWTREDRRQWPRLVRSTGEFFRHLRRRRFDISLDLQGLLRSSLVGLLAGVPRRIGFTDERREGAQWINNERIRPAQGHARRRYLSMAEHLGACCEPVEYGRLCTSADEQVACALLNGLGTNPTPLGVVPACSDPRRAWDTGKFVRVMEEVHRRHGLPAVVVGARADRRVAERICSACTSPVVNAAGRTSFGELAAILQRCRVVITGDTGPMHLAVAVGTPVVAIFGPSNPDITGPIGPLHRVVRQPFPCQPCYRRPVCTTGRDCLTAITPEQVLAAVEEVLEETRNGTRSPMNLRAAVHG